MQGFWTYWYMDFFEAELAGGGAQRFDYEYYLI